MLKKIILMFLLLLPMASAATIHGTVYDFGLEVLNNAKVSIDTTPQQTMISKDGTYSFEVSSGDYTITAETFSNGDVLSNVEEKILIVEEGIYRLDLVLLETMEEETALLEESEEIEIDIEGLEEEIHPLWWVLVAIVFIISIFIGYLSFRFIKARNYNEEEVNDAVDEISDQFENELDKLVAIIKKEGGRITQKDLRKRLGMSEAKVSLMITELEHKKVLKKIKKGRGNVLILNS